VAQNITHHRQDTEDVAQNAFVKGFRNSGSRATPEIIADAGLLRAGCSSFGSAAQREDTMCR